MVKARLKQKKCQLLLFCFPPRNGARIQVQGDQDGSGVGVLSLLREPLTKRAAISGTQGWKGAKGEEARNGKAFATESERRKASWRILPPFPISRAWQG